MNISGRVRGIEAEPSGGMSIVSKPHGYLASPHAPSIASPKRSHLSASAANWATPQVVSTRSARLDGTAPELKKTLVACQDAVFELYLSEEKIEPAVVENMRSWPHSGFSVDQSVLLPATLC